MGAELPPLTEGAMADIYQNKTIPPPTLQMLGAKKLGNGDRYRLLVSDGLVINSFTMTATQLNPLIEEGSLSEFSIFELTKWVMSNASNAGKPRKILVLLEIKVLVPGSEVGSRIGAPIAMEKSAIVTDVEDSGEPPAKKPAIQPSAKRAPARGGTSRLNETLSSGTHVNATPIAALNPYTNKWVIKVKVSHKSDVRSWSNARGEGKLFNFDLIDESGEIRCTGFREAVDKFYDMLQIGKCYYISRCQVKTANKQYNHLKNDFEMTMTNETEIVPCDDDDDDMKNVPLAKFDFITIAQIAKMETNQQVDVLAVVKHASDVQQLTSRAGKELKKRDIELVDMSDMAITLTLWGTQAENFDGSAHPVIALKGARIGEFQGGKSLSTLSSSILQLDPDTPGAHRLRGWWQTTGKEAQTSSISATSGGAMTGPSATLEKIREEGTAAGLPGAPTVHLCTATIALFRSENALYKACPTETCNKKVIDQGENFRCEKCNLDFPNYKYRLLGQVNIVDHTSQCWATAFSGEAEVIIGMTAQELGELMQQSEGDYAAAFAGVPFQEFTFKLKTQMENYNDSLRLRSTIQRVTQVNYRTYNKELLDMILEDK